MPLRRQSALPTSSVRFLTHRHFVPLAVFFFPIVKRFAIDLVHSRVSDFHFARLPSQKEIDVVSFSIGSLHIHAGKISRRRGPAIDRRGPLLNPERDPDLRIS